MLKILFWFVVLAATATCGTATAPLLLLACLFQSFALCVVPSGLQMKLKNVELLKYDDVEIAF